MDQAPEKLVIPYAPHEAQKEFHRSKARFRVLACGARFGKDRACVNDFIKKCVQMASGPGREKLIPAVNGWYIAPTYPLSQQMWAELKHFTQPFARFGRIVREADRQIDLPGGVELKIRSGYKPDSLVAEGVDYAVITEASLLDERVWEQNVRARLTSPGRGPMGMGGLATFNSTPRGRNWFWEAYLRGEDPAYPTWESFHNPTIRNPYIRPEEIEQARLEMPDRWFRQEFLAEFLDDGGGVFKGVRRALRVLPWPQGWQLGHLYVAGIDFGRHDDFTVVVVLDVTRLPWRVVALDRFTGIEYDDQLERIKRTLEPWRPMRVVPEQNNMGDPLCEKLVKDLPWNVQPFLTTATSKKQIVEGMSLHFQQDGIEIPATPKSILLGPDGKQILQAVVELKPLVCELEAYEYQKTRAGNVSYGAPSSMHDDCVMALCLAGHGAASGPIRVEAVGSTPDFSRMFGGGVVPSTGHSAIDYNKIFGR